MTGAAKVLEVIWQINLHYEWKEKMYGIRFIPEVVLINVYCIRFQILFCVRKYTLRVYKQHRPALPHTKAASAQYGGGTPVNPSTWGTVRKAEDRGLKVILLQ